MILRFKDTHSFKGIVETLVALVLVSDFCYSTASVLVLQWSRNVGEISSCAWFDGSMALPVSKLWYRYAWLEDNFSVPTVWSCCQQGKTENSYRHEVTSSYGEQLMAPGIFGFLENGDGTVFCVIRVFWWWEGAKEPQAELVPFWTDQQFWHD